MKTITIDIDNIPRLLITKDWHKKLFGLTNSFHQAFTALNIEDEEIIIQNNIDLVFVMKSFHEILKNKTAVDKLEDSKNTLLQSYCLKIMDYISNIDIVVEDNFKKIESVDDIKKEYLTPFIRKWFRAVQGHSDKPHDDITSERMLYALVSIRTPPNIIDIEDFDNYNELAKTMRFGDLDDFLNLPVIVDEYEKTLLEQSIANIKASSPSVEPTIRPNNTLY